MKEIKCSVIQDLLPLYVDEVVSEDTKLLVNEHLKSCEGCRKEVEQMKGTLVLPIESNLSFFSRFKKRWIRKKWMLILSSTLATAVVGFALFALLFYVTKPIEYSDKLFKVEEVADGSLAFNYFGVSHAGSHTTHPLEVEINGETKNIILINYVKTIANSPTRENLRKSNEVLTKPSDQFTLSDSQYADAIYYGEFDLVKVTIEKKLTWEELLESMTLIWER